MTRSVGSIAIVIALSLVASACSDSTPLPASSSSSSTPINSPSTSPSAADTGAASPGPSAGQNVPFPLPVPINDANAARDTLLQAAKGKEHQGFPVGWTAYQADLTFAGSLVTADGTHVSGFNFVFSKTKDASYLAFAVGDTKGACAGGLLLDDNETYTHIVAVNQVIVPAGRTCNGQTVADIAGYLG